MRIVLFALFVLLFSSCSSWKYYKADNTETRKSLSLGFSSGRFFSDKDTACAAVRLYNWQATDLTVSRDNVVLMAGSSVLSALSERAAKERKAFQTGVKKYYAGASLSGLYAGDMIVVPSKQSKTQLICFDLEGNKEPYSLSLRNLQIGGKDVKVDPFVFREVKQ